MLVEIMKQQGGSVSFLHAVKGKFIACVDALLMNDDAVQLRERPTMLAGGHA